MKRAQIICFGSSSMYGVGGAKGSWADLLKQDLHQEQYGLNGTGEGHELYNLAIPGATIEDFLGRIETDLIATRKSNRKLVSVIQLGGNNTKAVNTSENYVTSPQEFEVLVEKILTIVKKNSDEVLWVGMNLMDQTKVMPIPEDAERHRKVYFPNQRKIEFDAIAKRVCSNLQVKHLALIEMQQQIDWMRSYQYKDGIHPNDVGYRWIYEAIKPDLFELVNS